MRTSICLRSPPVFLIDLLRLILSRFFSVLWLTALTSSPEFSVARVLTWTNSHITFQTNYRPFKIQQNIDFSTSLPTCYVAACSLLAARLSEWALGSDWALGWAQLCRKVAPAPSHLLTKKQLQPQIRFWLMANETVSPFLHSSIPMNIECANTNVNTNTKKLPELQLWFASYQARRSTLSFITSLFPPQLTTTNFSVIASITISAFAIIISRLLSVLPPLTHFYILPPHPPPFPLYPSTKFSTQAHNIHLKLSSVSNWGMNPLFTSSLRISSYS